MAQVLSTDFPIDPATTSGTMLADILNRQQSALQTSNSGPTTPTETFPGMLWLDTSGGADGVLKIRNGANSAWLDFFTAILTPADPARLVAAGIVPAIGGTYSGLVNFNGGANFGGTPTENLATLNSLGIASVVESTNLWINSDLSRNTRGSTVTADAVYGYDRVVNLCDGGSTTLSLLAQPADGIPYALRQLQPDAVAKRMGSVQIVEARNCLGYRGRQLVFAPKVRCSAATTIRVALVAWTGTQDAPPRDVVAAWASTTYTAGNFFVANTLPIAVGSVALAANTWTDVPVSSASAGGVVAPSTMNNLYLVYWTNTAVAQNVTLDVSIMRAGLGVAVPMWTPPDAAHEYLRCQRYYEAGQFAQDAYGLPGTASSYVLAFQAEKRAAPSLSYSILSSANIAVADVRLPTSKGLSVYAQPAGAGGYGWTASWTAYAELGT